MPRFAILTHDYPTLHWDFLLENGANCRTWRLAVLPKLDVPIPATAIADHRCFYLDYEGPVRGQRGTVSRWDTGQFEWIVREPERVEIELSGLRLAGSCSLADTGEGNWTAIFHGRC